MAVAKMQKFNILTFLTDRDKVLSAIQASQKTELFTTRLYYETIETGNLFSGIAPSDQLETIESTLTAVNWAIKYLENYIPKPSALQKLRQKTPTYTLAEIEKIVTATDWAVEIATLREYEKTQRQFEQKRTDLTTEERNLTIWQYFDEKPSVLSNFTFTAGMMGAISTLQFEVFEQVMAEMSTTYYEVVQRDDNMVYLYVLVHNDSLTKVRNILQQNGFQQYKYQFQGKPIDELGQLKKSMADLCEQNRAITQELKAKTAVLAQLKVVAEYYQNWESREQISSKLLRTDYVLSISGWISHKDTAALIQCVKASVGENYYLEFQEVTTEALDEIPIKLENNRFVKPFESLVQMYSLPQYNEIDPTPLMVPFYLIAFGMMVADFGYGLILFVVITLAKKIFHFSEKMEQNLTFFQMGAVTTMLWGLVYGSFLGLDMPFRLLSITENVNEILGVAIAFGIMQILTGLAVKCYNLWVKQHKPIHAIFQAASWFFFIVALLLLVIAIWLNWVMLEQFAIITAIICVVAIIIGGSLEGKTIVGRIGSGLYGLMDMTSYIGDIISYSRLMALGIAGGCIAAAFNLIVNYFPPVARFTIGIVLFIVLHALNMFLSYLSAYVHGIRLQYVEFFGKFYTGGGRAFVPFQTADHYLKVTNEDQDFVTNDQEQ